MASYNMDYISNVDNVLLCEYCIEIIDTLSCVFII